MPCLCRNDGQAVESRVAIQVIDLASQNIVKTADAAPAARVQHLFPDARCLLCKISDFGQRGGRGQWPAVAWTEHRPVLPAPTPVRYSYTVRIIMVRQPDQFIQSSLATGFPTSSLTS